MIAFIPFLFIGCLLFLLFVGPIYFHFLERFLDRLRTEHVEKWQELGSPMLGLGNLGRSSLINYITKQGYLTLKDDKLLELGFMARAYLITSLSLIGIMFLSVFAFMVFAPNGNQ